MVAVGVEGGRSKGGGVIAMGRGGRMGSEVGAGATGSPRPAGSQRTPGVVPLRGVGCGTEGLMGDSEDRVAGMA